MKMQNIYRACLLAVERPLSCGCLVLCRVSFPAASVTAPHSALCTRRHVQYRNLLGCFLILGKIIIIIIIFVSPPTTDCHLSLGSAPHFLSLSVKLAPPCVPSLDWIGIGVGIGSLQHRVSVHLFLVYLKGLFLCVWSWEESSL